MESHCFYFLEDMYPIIVNECAASERFLIEGHYIESIVRAGKAAEIITETICNFEELDYIVRLGQAKRLEELGYKSVLPYEIYSKLDKVRRLRNKAVHGKLLNNEKDYADTVHHKLYDIAVWLYKTYGDDNFIASPYKGPVYSKKEPKDVVDEPIREPVHDVIQEPKSNFLSNYSFAKYNGSYLLNELSKLRDSSKEAVESDEEFSDFKKYIHVDRSIQEDFVKELKRVVNFNGSHLVMLCGSVGDGKSHLLAYLSTEFPDLLSEFKVHNDATESFDPDKDAIDTLADVLSNFNDYNIENSSEKRILAINLGVLNNFLESKHAKENYTKLKSYIDEANIFESKFVSKNIIQDKVSFITFSDYHLFELNNDVDSNYVSSKYISSLMGKITNNDEFNPFYAAYLKDKEQNYVNPLIYNYEMLRDENVQKVIIDILIKIFIKYRKIVSTRDLLNFIYELIVPPEIDDYDNFTNIEDFLKYLLPNMIFSSSERSSLLRLFSQFDPTLIRKEELDKFIIDLNINDNLKSVVSKYFDLSKLTFLEDYIDELGNLYEFDSSKKREIISTIIRFALFYGKPSIKKNFVDQTYLNFLKYLHAYNIQNTSEYKGLFNDIRDAIFMWRGSPKKNYLFVDELDSFKVSKSLNLKPLPIKLGDDLLEGLFLGNRFKTEIKVYFSVIPNNNKISLDVDYSLYEYIVKLGNGFKPNKSEKEDLIIFDEFIDALVDEPTEEGLLIRDLELNNDFYFEYDDFGDFVFKRG